MFLFSHIQSNICPLFPPPLLHFILVILVREILNVILISVVANDVEKF